MNNDCEGLRESDKGGCCTIRVTPVCSALAAAVNASTVMSANLGVACGFRSNPITESGASRSPIPIQPDH